VKQVQQGRDLVLGRRGLNDSREVATVGRDSEPVADGVTRIALVDDADAVEVGVAVRNHTRSLAYWVREGERYRAAGLPRSLDESTAPPLWMRGSCGPA
jgi:hypothetical protein